MEWWSLVMLFIIGQTLFETTSSQLLCACNLYPGVCETNCCCDNDCSESEKLTFEYCINTPPPEDDSKCYYGRVEYENNQPILTNYSAPGLLCLTKKNYNHLLYNVPDCGNTDCFAKAGISYSFQRDLTPFKLNENLTNGEYMAAQYSGVEGYFTVPGSLNNFCKDNPIQYLVSQASSCARRIDDVTASCSSNEYLNASTYYADTLIQGLPVTLLTCKLSNVDVDCGLYPIASATGCQGAVTSVEYTILTTQYGEITNVTCQIVLDTITTLGPINFEQKFSVNFITNSTEESIDLSGKPGYIRGKPLIALTYDDSSTALVSRESDVSISLINPDSSGICSSSESGERKPLLFGIDMQTQCKVRYYSNTPCQTLLTYIRYALEESTLLFDGGSVYVASFGNFTPPLQEVKMNVVPVVKSEFFPSYDDSAIVLDGCPGMIVGAHYTVAFAKVGDSNYPQNKVVGVKYEYQTLTFLTTSCFNKDCLTKEHSFSLTMSVSYVDVSEELTPVDATLLPIQIYFPPDFFFPFTSSANMPCSSCLTALFVVLILSYLML